jgi:phage antirepressor YoqD-like protein
MNDLTPYGDRRMTVREVADVLGLDPRSVQMKVKELFPGIVENGKATFLTEIQVTAVKMNLEKKFEVKTALEKALLVQQALLLQQEQIAEMQAEIAEKDKRLSIAEPKAEYHDRLVDGSHCTNLRDTAKELGVPERRFINTLLAKGYLYRDHSGALKPYHDKMKYFSVKDFERDGYSGVQCFVTVEGKDHFMKLFPTTIFFEPGLGLREATP